MTLALWFCGAGAVFVVLFASLSALTGKRYKFRDGMVQGVVGVMGAGKSVFTIARVLLPAAKGITSKAGLWSTSGRQVKRIICNFDVELGYPVEVIQLRGADLWDHLYELAMDNAIWNEAREIWEPRLDAVVLVDEADLYLTNEKMRMPAKARFLLKMMRKMNAEFWWICQYENQVHVSLRRHTSIVWSMRHSAPLWTLITGSASRWFVGEGWLSVAGVVKRTAGKPVQTVRYRRSRRVDRAYNSFELIVPLTEAERDLSRDAFTGRRLRELPAELVDELQADELSSDVEVEA